MRFWNQKKQLAFDNYCKNASDDTFTAMQQIYTEEDQKMKAAFEADHAEDLNTLRSLLERVCINTFKDLIDFILGE